MGFFNDRKKAQLRKAQLEAEARAIEAAKEAAKSADNQADSWLIKIAKNKWSWAIAIAIIASAWLLGFIQR